MMINAKAFLKQVFYKAGGAPLLDKMLFGMAAYRYKKKNRAFREAHQSLAIPPDYFLYETCRLDYASYFADGEVGAREIMEWTQPYRDTTIPQEIMEWGCGVSRIVRHLPALMEPGTKVHGCDINEDMIAWNKTHIPGVAYTHIAYDPPMPYQGGQFTLVYAISVFTHIDAAAQPDWVKEIHRVLKPGGVFLFTTHGIHYEAQLLPDERKTLAVSGVFTKSYNKKGHRMMTSYNRRESFECLLQGYFHVVEYYDGGRHPEKMGGQDMWIVQKH
jgi:SAM-dependent methyltransferase